MGNRQCGRTVSPFTTSMPRGRGNSAPHVGNEPHSTLTQEKSWPPTDIGYLHFSFHDLGLRGDFPSRWGRSHHYMQARKIVVVFSMNFGWCESFWPH